MSTILILSVLTLPLATPLNLPFNVDTSSQLVYADDNYKDITNSGNTFSKDMVKATMTVSAKYQLLPSFVICQLFIETHWGTASTAGQVDNNWGGIKYPGAGSGVKVSQGSSVTEYGHTSSYAHYNSPSDYLQDYAYLLRKEGNYAVSGKADFQESVKGLFKSAGTGAKVEYAEAGYSHYVALMTPTRSAINQQNGNILDALDKQAVKDGKWTGSVPTKEEQATETKEAIKTLANSDDNFLVNGYGALTAKDWKETIDNAQDYVNNINPEKDLSSTQKTNLNEWIDDYNYKTASTSVRLTHQVITIIAFATLLYGLLLTLGYAFDRVGILEISALSFLTLGKLETAYLKEESTFMMKKQPGVPKYVASKDIIIINLMIVALFTFISTGMIYRFAFLIYQWASIIINFGNSLH